MEGPSILSKWLQGWQDLKDLGNLCQFNVVYWLQPDLDKDPAKGKLVRETLGHWVNLPRCAMWLLNNYPDEVFTEGDVHRCVDIWQTIVARCSYHDMQSSESVEFGFENYYCKPGEQLRFSTRRAKIAEELLNAPGIDVICTELGCLEDIPKEEATTPPHMFKLLQLIRDDEAYAVFTQTWVEGRFFEDTVGVPEELEVEVVRVRRVMEETSKMCTDLVATMGAMTQNFTTYTEALTARTNILAGGVLEQVQAKDAKYQELITQQGVTIELLQARIQKLESENQKLVEDFEAVGHELDRQLAEEK